MQEAVSILLQSGSGTEALRRLLAWNREINSKWSYTWIAKQLGLSSKGHIADILSGRRVLATRLWQPCLDLLGLKSVARKYCEALLSIEEQIIDGQDIAVTSYEQLETWRKSLKSQQHNYSDRIASNHMIMQVHSAFGLYGYTVTQRQLIQFFGREHVVEIDRALSILLTEGLIEKLPQAFRLKPEARHILVLGPQPNTQNVINYLQQGLEQSKQALPKWAEQPDVSCFRQSHVSVKRSEYIKHLEAVKAEMLRMQNAMSADEGDMLVRFDLQIYPIGEKAPEV